MRVEYEVTVRAPKAEVWKLVTDFDNAASRISGIEKIEVLERPAAGLVGFKWRETRTLFGKTATEVMWITAVDEGSRYTTEARSHGSIYRTEIGVQDHPEGTRLWGVFEAEPQSLGAKVMSALLGFMVKGSMKKALLQDFLDVKAAAETGRRADPGPRPGAA
jgi:carbon monoxide dehydrogenase subunit G